MSNDLFGVHMAPEANNKEPYVFQSQELRKMAQEVRIIQHEMNIESIIATKKQVEGWRKSSNDLKNFIVKENWKGDWEDLIINLEERAIELEKKERKQEKKRQRILELEKAEEELIKVKASIAEKEKKESEERINKLERELYSLKNQNFNKRFNDNSRVRGPMECYNCKKVEHIAKDCPNIINKNSSGYSVLFNSKNNGKEQKMNDVRAKQTNGDVIAEEETKPVEEIKSVKEIKPVEEIKSVKEIKPVEEIRSVETTNSIEIMKKEFPTVLLETQEEIKYCDKEKCRINTEDGERIVQKGQIIPQALRKRTLEYLNSLEKRKIIRMEESNQSNRKRQWRG